MVLTSRDMILRVDNSETNIKEANSLASIDELNDIIKFRFDADAWNNATDELKIRAAVTAYNDLKRLKWKRERYKSQSRDYDFLDVTNREIPNYDMPFDSDFFLEEVKNAQASQVMFILHGTQVRDMAREGIKMSTAFSGSEMGIGNYKGAVCTEAKEHIIQWIDNGIKLGRG